MSTLRANGLAFIFMLVSLPLIAIGSLEGPDELWIGGLIVLGVALIVPTATRWLGGNGDDDEEDDS